MNFAINATKLVNFSNNTLTSEKKHSGNLQGTQEIQHHNGPHGYKSQGRLNSQAVPSQPWMDSPHPPAPAVGL